MEDLRSTDKAISLILTAAFAVGIAGGMARTEQTASEDTTVETEQITADETIELSDESGTVTIDAGGTYEITGETSDGETPPELPEEM